MEEAINQSEFEYPPQTLESEIDTVINNLKSNLERQNLDLDLYKKTRDIDDDGLREEALPVAEERLKRTLFLYKLAEVEELEVDDSQVQTEAQQTINYLSQSLSYSEARKLSNDNFNRQFGVEHQSGFDNKACNGTFSGCLQRKNR